MEELKAVAVKRCSVFLDPTIKPPCVQCGRESEVWLVNGSHITRVCRDCAAVFQDLCREYQGKEIHCIMAAWFGFTDFILVDGDWVDFALWSFKNDNRS